MDNETYTRYASEDLLQEVARLRAENKRLKVAYGLVLDLHGCGGANCTEEEYLKDALSLMEENAQLKKQVAELSKPVTATVVKTSVGPELHVNGVLTRTWLGTIYDLTAYRLARDINAARAGKEPADDTPTM